jgi:alkaline phosphatase
MRPSPALLLLALSLAGPAAAAPGRRHVILFVGDGMQRAHEVAASRFLFGRDDGLAFHDPTAFAFQGWATTWDLTTWERRAAARGLPRRGDGALDPLVGYDPARCGAVPHPLAPVPDEGCFVEPSGAMAPATDSASSATSLATGRKTDTGNIAWAPGDPPGGALTTIAEAARAGPGAAIGVVTTVPFTHATPAAFVAHATSRQRYAEIGAEIVRVTRPEVVIGGGWPGGGWLPDHQWVAPAEVAALRSGAAGYALVERAAGVDGGAALLAAADRLPAGGRLFGLFGGPQGNFEPPVADRSGEVRRATSEDPTLAQATRAALTVLSRDPHGFFLLVEQGDIDWANHQGDLPRMIGTIQDLDRAVREAMAFVDRPGDGVTWENTLLVVTADHATNHLRLGPGRPPGRGVLPAVDARGRPTDPAQYRLPPPGAAGGYDHTNELVTLAARGGGAGLLAARAGRWYPGTRIVDQTQVWQAMAEFLGVVRPPARP